ncbi:MAG: DUF1269 domain-containing protein [Chloroflexota bacterium]
MPDERAVAEEVDSTGEYALIAAAFTDASLADDAINTIKRTEAAGEIVVEGVLKVRTDGDGDIHVVEMTDHSTKSGAKWGVVGGLALAVVFPPSLLAGAVAGGALGGVIGKLRNVHHRSQVADELGEALPPDSSGIIALVRIEDAVTVRASMPPALKVTTATVDAAAASDIREAARQAS